MEFGGAKKVLFSHFISYLTVTSELDFENFHPFFHDDVDPASFNGYTVYIAKQLAT